VPESGEAVVSEKDVPPDFTLYHFNSGGMGARPSKDGLSTTCFPAGVKTQSVEASEQAVPVVFWRKELREGSGGAGRFRGGLGQTIEIGGANGKAFSVFSMFDRVENPAAGRSGGCDGAAGHVALASGRVLPSKGHRVVPGGDRLVLEVPGGGGFGPPCERDPEQVRADVERGFVSAEEARSVYAVALAGDDAVDVAETVRLRQQVADRRVTSREREHAREM
jgi:N-methylhydantoinase B